MRDSNNHRHGTDRDGKWSTATVLMAMFLGFTIGFVTCHELYGGITIGVVQ